MCVHTGAQITYGGKSTVTPVTPLGVLITPTTGAVTHLDSSLACRSVPYIISRHASDYPCLNRIPCFTPGLTSSSRRHRRWSGVRPTPRGSQHCYFNTGQPIPLTPAPKLSALQPQHSVEHRASPDGAPVAAPVEVNGFSVSTNRPLDNAVITAVRDADSAANATDTATDALPSGNTQGAHKQSSCLHEHRGTKGVKV